MISKSRKILAGVLSLAMVLTIVAGVASAANAQTTTTTVTTTATSSTYTRDLTVGSTGADVTAIQSTLYAAGYLKVAPTGYFGSLTKAALAAWQASVGISPASGYFGPITRAYVATMGTGTVSTVPGCSAGAMFSTTTGQPCTTTTSTVPGCMAGAMFSSTTGQPCTTTTSTVPGCTAGAMFSTTTGQSCTTGGTTMNNSQGTLIVNQAPSPATNANITTNMDVPVYGLQLQAQFGDVTVQRLDLAVTVQNQTSSYYDNPGSFINNIKVWDGSTIILNRNVSASDFVNTSNSTNQYHILLSGFNFTVPAGQTKNLVVSFTTSGSIDDNRVITITGNGSSGLQAVSGGNIVSYYDISNISLQQTFKNPSTSTTVSVGTDSSNPIAAVNYLDSNNGATDVPVLAFNVYSSNSNVTLKQVNVSIATSTAAPSSLSLYDGTVLLASRAIPTGTNTVSFTNLTDAVTSGQTKVLTVKASYPSSATGASVTVTLGTVTYQTATGTTQPANGSAAGNVQTFKSVSANLALVSASATSAGSDNNGKTTAITGTFNLKVHPQPGQMVKPVASDFVVKYGTSLGSAATVPTASTTISSFNPNPTGSVLSSNTDTYFTLSAVVNGSDLATGSYQFWITSASTTVSNSAGTPVNTVDTTSLTNFYSQPITVVR